MGILKLSVFVLFIAIGSFYFFGENSNFRFYIPEKILPFLDKYVPKSTKSQQPDVEKTTTPNAQQEPLKRKNGKARIITKDHLWKYYRGGEGSRGLYIAFMGKIYDVSKGKQYYQPGGGYAFFAGRDGTRGFVTGDFTDEGLIDTLDGLKPEEYLGFDEWESFYASDYKFVGYLVGNFYDDQGQPTQALLDAQKLIQEAKERKKMRDEDTKKFPMCNSESSAAKGARLWCTENSGGTKRDWVGVPRLYHAPGAREARCACVRNTGPDSEGKNADKNRGDLDNPRLKEYNGCSDPNTQTCVVRAPKKN